ncbi:MAG: F-box protein [Parachlamydiaceae bacterium]|nr:MAG: F-box protein [Parachlamydiaceae bacterium]
MPHEIWTKIFELLDDSNLRRATCVCKQWKEIGHSSSIWISWIRYYSPAQYENLAAIKTLTTINWAAIGKGLQRQRSYELKIEREIIKIEKDHQEIKKTFYLNLNLIIYSVLLKGF